MRSRKGQLVLYLNFIVTAIVIVLMAAVLVPVGVTFNSAAYVQGEGIMHMSDKYIDSIENDTVRSGLQDVFTTSLGATQENIEVGNDIFRYGWVAVLVISALILFLFGRRITEASGGIA